MSVSAAPMELDDDVPAPVKQLQAGDAPSVGPYLLGAELGEGGFSTVHLGVNQKTGQRVALKVLKKRLGTANNQQERNEELQVRREIAAMSKLEHPNILRLVEVNWNVPEKNLGRAGNGTSVVVVLEFAAGGELFEFLSYTGAFEESIARTYFHQLVSAVAYAHTHGVFHRDLKPENLLLDADFTLKLADFGFSNMLDPLGNNNLLYTECGTPGYMAPEMFQNRGYEPNPVDIWACGVILFIMLAGFPPFQKPNISDWWFQKLASNRQHLFWQAHSRSCYFSEPTKDFLNKILTPDPKKRITLAQLQKHEWFVNGPRLPAQQLQQELQRRKQTVNERKIREQQEIARQNAMRAGAAAGALGQAVARDLPLGNPDVFMGGAAAAGGARRNVMQQQMQSSSPQPRFKAAERPRISQPAPGAPSAFADEFSSFGMVFLESSVAVRSRDSKREAAPRPQPQLYQPFLLGGECYTKFQTLADPQEVLDRLVSLFDGMDCRYSLTKDQFRVRADISTLTGMVRISAQVFKMETSEEDAAAGLEQFVVEVRRRSGPALAYQSLFNMIFTDMEDLIITNEVEEEEEEEEPEAGAPEQAGEPEGEPDGEPEGEPEGEGEQPSAEEIALAQELAQL